MEIKFTKKPDAEHVISCIRKDGSISWQHSSTFFIMHDLCHYAAETVMNWKHGFYGIVAAGTHITAFDVPKDQRSFQLTDEAILAEQLVNLLVIEYNQGKMNNLLQMLAAIYDKDENDLPAVITNEKLEAIRTLFSSLMQQWQALEDYKTITLLFEE